MRVARRWAVDCVQGQAVGLVHVGDDRRPRERVHCRPGLVRRGLPDPVRQLLFRADVVGDVLRALVAGLGIEDLVSQERGQLRLGLQQESESV